MPDLRERGADPHHRADAAPPPSTTTEPTTTFGEHQAVTVMDHSEKAVEPAVIDGEIVEENDNQRPPADRGGLARRQTVHVITTLAKPSTVKAVGQSAARVGYTTVQGHMSWVRRASNAATHGVIREQIRAARLAGDREALAEWTERLEDAKDARSKRLLALPKMVLNALIVATIATIGLLFLLLIAGIAAWIMPGGIGWTDWWGGIGTVIGTTAAVVKFVAGAGVFLGLPLLLVLAYREGRRAGDPPRWLATSADADVDVTIDETTIAAALAALRIPQITDYLKAGTPLQFITPARVDGRGTHAVIRLPIGVSAEKIAKRRVDLATGLHRQAKEVWPTTGSEAGILDLWVADKGALAEGAGRYPLLDGGLTDVFKGVPAGKNLRGTPITAPLMERNTITGGQPGQGKSASARVLMVGAALDPTAELRIWVPDTNFDFEVFKPRCSRYVMGAEDEKIAEIRDDLRELHAEVQRRGQILVEHETAAVTRELANRGIGLHPLFCLLEEAHVAIQHDTYGKEISKLLVDIVKLGRKRGIHLIVSTQAPTKDSIPRDVTRNCSNGIAFAVGDHVANDGLLGQGAYRAGHRATELIPGTDRGTAVVKGFTGARSEILQWYFLSVDEGNDDVTPLIERSLEAIKRRGKGLPGAGAAPAREAAPVLDPLADIAEVLGTEKRMRTVEVLSRLGEHNRDAYGSWDAGKLTAVLAAEGIRTVKVQGVMCVRAADVHERLADRLLDTDDPDDADDVMDTDGDDEAIEDANDD